MRLDKVHAPRHVTTHTSSCDEVHAPCQVTSGLNPVPLCALGLWDRVDPMTDPCSLFVCGLKCYIKHLCDTLRAQVLYDDGVWYTGILEAGPELRDGKCIEKTRAKVILLWLLP